MGRASSIRECRTSQRIVCSVLLIGFIFLAVSLVNLVLQLLPLRFFDNPVATRRLVDVGVSSLLPFAAAYFYGTKLSWILALVGTILLVFVSFVVPLIVNRNVTGYFNEIEAHDSKLREHEPRMSIFRLAARRLGPNLPLVLWLSIFMVFLAESAGRAAAENETQFLVTKIGLSSELIVLRAYNDVVILAPFDRQKHEVQKSFSIVKFEDLKTPLNLEEVGPFNPVKFEHAAQVSTEATPSRPRAPEATPSSSPRE